MFKHKLHFKSVPEIGTLVISEPVGFDKQGFIIKQDEKYFGRNIFIGKEESDFQFTKMYFEQTQTIQILPNGDVIDHASHGFFYLRDVLTNLGWEAEIEYIIEKDGVSFIIGVLDGFTAQIEFDKITIRSIQNTNRELIKRLEDTDIDAFSNKALDGRTITPCQTVNVLMKAKPVVNESEWSNSNTNTYTAGGFGGTFTRSLNVINNVVKSNIDNTLSYIAGYEPTANFVYIRALTELSELNISLEINLDFFDDRSSSLGFATLSLRYFIGINPPTSNGGTSVFNAQLFEGTSSVTIGQTFFLENLNMNAGETLWIWFLHVTNTQNALYFSNVKFNNSKINAIATATAIDSIVSGVRLRDLANHAIQSMANIPSSFDGYEANEEHYQNICFNGLLLGQVTDKPFYNKFKDLKDIFLETCTGHQINQNDIQFLPYNDFYSDELLAEFEESPEFDAKIINSKEFALKTAEFAFKTSSTNRETSGANTIDDVHTRTQKLLSDKVDGTLKVEFDHIRSAFLGEEARMRAFDNKNTNALQNDNKLFVYKCVPLPPNYRTSLSAVLLMQVDEDGFLRILNINDNGNGLPFSWNLLGISTFSTITISGEENAGSYFVLSITPSVIKLGGSSGTTPTFNGQSFITIEYFLQGVPLMIKTNEGFDLIEGVQNPTNYGNLDYSLGRIVNYWKPYLSTATKYKPAGEIQTTSFINNGNLVTRKAGETENVIDSENIQNASILDLKKITPRVKSVKVYCPFEKALQLVEDIGTKKGFVKVGNFYGYPKELDYTWISEELIMDLQEKYLGDYMIIDENGVKEIGGEYKNNISSYEINTIYLSLFDENGKSITEPTDYRSVMINGVLFTDKILFAEALQNYLDNE